MVKRRCCNLRPKSQATKVTSAPSAFSDFDFLAALRLSVSAVKRRCCSLRQNPRNNAPSVLSLTSVADPREDAAPELRNRLSLVFSVSLWLRGEQDAPGCPQRCSNGFRRD